MLPANVCMVPLAQGSPSDKMDVAPTNKEDAELLTVQDKAKDLSKRALAKATAINKITLALTVLPYAQAVKSELDSYHDKFKHLGSMLIMFPEFSHDLMAVCCLLDYTAGKSTRMWSRCFRATAKWRSRTFLSGSSS